MAPQYPRKIIHREAFCLFHVKHFKWTAAHRIMIVAMGPDFLFVQPSWLSGVARTLDLAGQFDEYNESHTVENADAKAQFLDWWAVGGSLFGAMKAFGSENKVQQTDSK